MMQPPPPQPPSQDPYDKDIQRLEHSIEMLQVGYATLRDMDRRFAEDRTRIQNLESKLLDHNRMYIDIVDRINSTFDLKLANNLKPITEQIQRLDTKVDTMKEKSSESLATTIRYIISVLVSFILGSGAIGAIQYLESIVKK